MNNPPDNDFWGMTAAILRKLDAKEWARQENTDPSPAKPSNSAKREGAAPGHSNSSARIASLHKLAVLYHTRKNFEQAERLYQQVLAAMGEPVGPATPSFPSSSTISGVCVST